MIFSKLAPELFPSILPSVEYLAKDVPVPIQSSDSEYVNFMCVLRPLKCIACILKDKMRDLRNNL